MSLAGDLIGGQPRSRWQVGEPWSRPNALWVADFTHMAAWAGFICVAFVLDAYGCIRVIVWLEGGQSELCPRSPHNAYSLNRSRDDPVVRGEPQIIVEDVEGHGRRERVVENVAVLPGESQC